jgi:hypothetical protein
VQISKVRDDIARCDQERAKAQEVLDRSENRTTRDQSKFINTLIRRKSFSWTQVFSDLEQMMPHELHVTAIHPEVTKDNQLEVKLSVAGKTRDRALQLVHHMEQSPRFFQPVVTDEQFQQNQNGDNVHFEITSGYIPQVDLAMAPAKTEVTRSGSSKEETPKANGTKPGSVKTGVSKPPVKTSVPKPTAGKAPMAADRKAP